MPVILMKDSLTEELGFQNDQKAGLAISKEDEEQRAERNESEQSYVSSQHSARFGFLSGLVSAAKRASVLRRSGQCEYQSNNSTALAI